MNPKILGAFAGGVLASGAIFYFASNRQPAPVTAPPAEKIAVAKAGEPPAPAPMVVESVQPKPAPTEPVREKPAPQPAAAHDRWPTAAKSVSKPVATAPAPPPAVVARAQQTTTPEPVSEKPEPAKRVEAPPAEPPKPIETPKPVEASRPVESTHREQIPLNPASGTSRPSEPRKVTLSGGTLLTVRLAEPLSSSKQKSGDPFRATLDQPLIVDGLVIAERGSPIEGRVVEAEKAGKATGTSRLQLELIRFTSSDGQTVGIRTASYEQEGNAGSGSKTDAAKKVGIGAAAGAVLGGIFGGGKGAGIGAAAGGAAGGGVVLATRGKPVEVPAETRMTFRLTDPVVVTEQINR